MARWLDKSKRYQDYFNNRSSEIIMAKALIISSYE